MSAIGTQKWMEKSLSEFAEMGDMEIREDENTLITPEIFREKLTAIIAWLLDHNFEKLLWLLYRVDVDEEKAKSLLAKHIPEDAPDILADLIIQRLEKKEALRKEFEAHTKAPEPDDELSL